jgi:AcrR family transcriptional regulator
MTAVGTRERVLASAAELAAREGFDTITTAKLSASSGVSNGSIYHHFGSKEGVLAALLAEIITGYQHTVLAVLDTHTDDAHTGVLATVAAHLRWTEHHRDQAMLLQRYRDQVTHGAHREQVRDLNRHFRDRNEAWLRRQANAGALPPVTVEVAHAVVFAPAREVCRVWLTHDDFPPPTSFSDALGQAAWAGLRALADKEPR